MLLVALATAGLGCREAASHEESEAAPRLAFVDVTEGAGLGDFRHQTGAFGQKWMPETFGSGGAFVDYDGDGWQDVLLVGGGVWDGHGEPVPALQLFRNDHDGTFTRVTADVGLAGVHGYGFGATAADYDGDGDQDVFLTTVYENMLFRNDGGTFTEVGHEAGLADEAVWGTAAVFLDADRDGWLDLFVGNYVPWTPETDRWCTSDGETKDYCTPHQYPGTSGRFYHNDGDGTFTDWTERSGLGVGPGKTLGAALLDYDADGWPDLVVANDTERDLLFHNRGDGTFEEVGVGSGLAFDQNGRARAGMGVDAAALDGSGRPTVVVGNFSEEMVGLYEYQGRGLFVDRGPASQVGLPSFESLTFGLFFFDADLDADLDLLLANGHIMEQVQQLQPNITYRQPAQLFLNQDDGTFALATGAGAVFDRGLVGRGAAYADYDRDGDLDVLVTENGGPAHLWRNEMNPGVRDDVHVLRVRLDGAPPNREAVGARVVVVTGDRRQERRVRTGGSYLSQSETTVTFGLGPAAQADTVYVHWPGGSVDVFDQVEAGQEVRVLEGEQKLHPTPLGRRSS